MPFNWRTPLGYLAALSFEYILLRSSFVFFHSLVCFYIGSCLLLKTFVEDITNDIRSLNAIDNKKSDGNRTKEIRTIFANVVQDHAALKQLSSNSAKYTFLYIKLS